MCHAFYLSESHQSTWNTFKVSSTSGIRKKQDDPVLIHDLNFSIGKLMSPSSTKNIDCCKITWHAAHNSNKVREMVNWSMDDERVDGRMVWGTDGWVLTWTNDGWIDGWTDGLRDGRMDAYVDERWLDRWVDKWGIRRACRHIIPLSISDRAAPVRHVGAHVENTKYI